MSSVFAIFVNVEIWNGFDLEKWRGCGVKVHGFIDSGGNKLVQSNKAPNSRSSQERSGAHVFHYFLNQLLRIQCLQLRI